MSNTKSRVPSTAPGVLATADREMSCRSGAEGNALSDRPDETEQFSGHCSGCDDGAFSSISESMVVVPQGVV